MPRLGCGTLLVGMLAARLGWWPLLMARGGVEAYGAAV